MSSISIRDALSRTGKGIREVGWEIGHEQPLQRGDRELPETEKIYRCSEVISTREIAELHAHQDGSRAYLESLRKWIRTHCDADSRQTVISDYPDLQVVNIGGDNWGSQVYGNWIPVQGSEDTRILAGYQQYSRVTNTDHPFRHETRDWNWDVVPSPAFTYLLTESMTGIDRPLDDKPLPKIHNEWETGSMPLEWRPFWGEYITMYGRHIFDVGHTPYKTEIHPAFAIIREHTTAARLGDGNRFVPVNRAIIGMGFSGGFPGGGSKGDTDDRWADEFGRVPDDIEGDTTDCWPTNLANHPIAFQMFPPVPRPSSTADLRYRIVLCEAIEASTFEEVDEFLELCQYDYPAGGNEELAFRVWNRSKRLPHGFTPRVAPTSVYPQFELRDDRYFDVEVDLSPIGPPQSIPLGYYAIVECGWSERGPHEIYQFDIEFDKLIVNRTAEWYDDWHLYNGVNGKWGAWWTDDSIEQDTYTVGRSFRVFTIDNMPLLLRDCGVEWDGTDLGNDYLEQIRFDIPGPSHLNTLAGLRGVQVLNGGNPRRYRLTALETGDNTTDHQWDISIKRRLR